MSEYEHRQPKLVILEHKVVVVVVVVHQAI